jgi:hypothetical protein
VEPEDRAGAKPADINPRFLSGVAVHPIVVRPECHGEEFGGWLGERHGVAMLSAVPDLCRSGARFGGGAAAREGPNTMESEGFERSNVPDGHIGVTVSVYGINTFTMAIEAGAVEDVFAFIERASGFGQAGRQDPAVHETIRRATEHMLRHPPGNAELLRQTAAMAVLWCALNHPGQGARLRAELSEDLRVHGASCLVAIADASHAWRYVPVRRAADTPYASGLQAASIGSQGRKGLNGSAKPGFH